MKQDTAQKVLAVLNQAKDAVEKAIAEVEQYDVRTEDTNVVEEKHAISNVKIVTVEKDGKEYPLAVAQTEEGFIAGTPGKEVDATPVATEEEAIENAKALL